MSKRCLICENEIKADAIGVCDATIWTSEGNYGSGVYDPMSGSVFLEAAICDGCLKSKRDFVEEVVVKQSTEVLERRRPDF
jgi:hypothetical protein